MKTALKQADAVAPQNNIPDFGYMRLPQVLEVIPIGRSTWWHWVATEKAPKPVKLSERVTAWRVSDIKALAARLQTSEASNEA